jgi:fatty acid desaturase
MMAALTTAITAILGFFEDMFTMITSADVIPWVIIGVAVPLIGFCVGLFKRIVWGKN